MHEIESYRRELISINESMSTNLIFCFMVNTDGIMAFKYILFCLVSYQLSYRDLHSPKNFDVSYFLKTYADVIVIYSGNM